MLMDTPKFTNTAGVANKADGSRYVGGALYDIAGSTLSQPTDAAVLMRFSVNRAFDLPSGLTGSKAESTVAAAAATTYSLQKNGTEVGTLNWASSATDATFTLASTTSFAVGDILTLVAPGTADSTHDELSWTLAATLT